MQRKTRFVGKPPAYPRLYLFIHHIRPRIHFIVVIPDSDANIRPGPQCKIKPVHRGPCARGRELIGKGKILACREINRHLGVNAISRVRRRRVSLGVGLGSRLDDRRGTGDIIL